MAIPSRQIGWSTKSNLLWQIAKQLNYLTCVAACECPTTTTTTTILPTTTTTTTTVNTNMSVMVPYSSEFDYFNIPVVSEDTSGDFTIEWFMYLERDDNHPRIWSIGNFYDGAASAVSIENGTLYYWINGTIIQSYNLAEFAYLSTWVHVCIERSGDTIYIFLNGFLLGSSTYLSDIPTRGLPLYLGSEGVDSLMNGNISNFRWVVGNAVYPTTGFVPPVNDLEIVIDGHYTRLLTFQGTNLSLELTDNSGNNTLVNGSGTYSNNNPFVGQVGSILFGS